MRPRPAARSWNGSRARSCPAWPCCARSSSAHVVVHHLEQARAALAAAAAAGCAIELRSAPGAAGYAGVGYLKALGEQAGQELVIDCGEDAGLVMAALRTGCRRLVFSGSEEVRRRLADMAEQLGAELIAGAPAPEVLILQPEDDAAAVLRSRLRSMP
jgi:hypothetical protein